MKISVCMIAKNEERNIARALRPLRGAADEMIVVDTGSGDATAAIAAELGARVCACEWTDDFAAAKNFALAQAGGDWVIFLDADEFFEEQAARLIRPLLSAAAEETDGLLTRLVNIDEEQENKVIDSFFTVRIFRRRPQIQYAGRIHEQLCRTDRKDLTLESVPPETLQIYHTGYSSGKRAMKARRNLALLREEVKTAPRPEELYAYLAEALYGAEDFSEAARYARLDMANGRRPVTYASRSCRVLLQALQKLSGGGEYERAVVDAMRMFPELPEFRAEYAVCLYEKLDFEGALRQLRAAIDLKTNYSSSEPTAFTDETIAAAKENIARWSEVLNLSRTLTVSACVIAKNEEKNIGRWLRSLRQCSDEQIVVDTGSEDRTAVIAAQGGANVYRLEWENDFAKAKNFALEQASGDWIVFLDADEYFSEETVGNVRRVIAREHLRADAVDVILCTLINIDDDQNGLELNRFKSLRIFRRSPHLKFRGNIHECVRHDARELRILIDKGHLEIYHTGYSAHSVQGKLRRNLQLLREDIAQNGESASHYQYLLDCYYGLGDYERAIHYAKLHLASNGHAVGTESNIYRNLIHAMVRLQRNPREILPYAQEALRLFADIPDFYAYYASLLFQLEQKKEAKPYLLKALAIYEQRSNGTVVTSSSFGAIVSEVYSHLSEIYAMEGEAAQAERMVRASLRENRWNQKAFGQFCALLHTKKAADAAVCLADYYGMSRRELLFILRGLSGLPYEDLYAYYERAYEESCGRPLEFMAARRLLTDGAYDELYEKCLRGCAEEIRHLASALLLGDASLLRLYGDALPPDFQRVIAAYQEGGALAPEAYDAYAVLLAQALLMSGGEPVRRYLRLAKSFDERHRREVFLQACRGERYEEADVLLPQDDAWAEAQTPETMYAAGLVHYHLRRWETARRFLRAAVAGGCKNNDIASYLRWIEERIS